ASTRIRRARASVSGWQHWVGLGNPFDLAHLKCPKCVESRWGHQIAFVDLIRSGFRNMRMFLEPGAEFSSYSLNISIAFAPGGGGRLTPTLAFARSTSRSGPTAGGQSGGSAGCAPPDPAEVALIVRMRAR